MAWQNFCPDQDGFVDAIFEAIAPCKQCLVQGWKYCYCPRLWCDWHWWWLLWLYNLNYILKGIIIENSYCVEEYLLLTNNNKLVIWYVTTLEMDSSMITQ